MKSTRCETSIMRSMTHDDEDDTLFHFESSLPNQWSCSISIVYFKCHRNMKSFNNTTASKLKPLKIGCVSLKNVRIKRSLHNVKDQFNSTFINLRKKYIDVGL